MQKQLSPLSINITFWIINLLLFLSIYSFYIILTKSTIPWLLSDPETTLTHNGVTEMNQAENQKMIRHFIIQSLFSLCAVSATFISFYFFRKLIKNVKSGNPFTTENISLLKKFSIGIAVSGMIGISQSLFSQFFEQTNDDFFLIYSDYIWFLIVAIIIWSLTHVFSIGLNLQNEKDLTI